MTKRIPLTLSLLAVVASLGCNDEIKIENRTFQQLCEMSGGTINPDNNKQCMCGEDRTDKCDEGVTCVNNGEFCANSTENCTFDKLGNELCINIKSVGNIKVCKEIGKDKYYYVDKEPADICSNDYSCTEDKSQCGICKNNSRKCENSTIYKCEYGEWVESYSCPNGASCLTNAETDTPESDQSDVNCGECKNGTRQCITESEVSKPQTCVNGVWTTDTMVDEDGETVEKTCGEFTCNLENTACADCANGKKKCSDGILSTCVNGIWTEAVVCPFNASCIEVGDEDTDYVEMKCGICAEDDVRCSVKTDDESGELVAFTEKCVQGQWENVNRCPTPICDGTGKVCGACNSGEQKCIIYSADDSTTKESVYTCVNGVWSVEDCFDHSCQTLENETIICGDCKNDAILSCDNIEDEINTYVGQFVKCKNGSKEDSELEPEYCPDDYLCADGRCGDHKYGDMLCGEGDEGNLILKYEMLEDETIGWSKEDCSDSDSDPENHADDYVCIQNDFGEIGCGCVEDKRKVVFEKQLEPEEKDVPKSLEICHDGRWGAITDAEIEDKRVCDENNFYSYEGEEIKPTPFVCQSDEPDGPFYRYVCSNENSVEKVECPNGCIDGTNECAECKDGDIYKCVNDPTGKAILTKCIGGIVKDEPDRSNNSCNADGTNVGVCLNDTISCANNSNEIGVINACHEGSMIKTSCNGVSCAGASCGVCKNGDKKCENDSSGKAQMYTCASGVWGSPSTTNDKSCNAQGTDVGSCLNGTISCSNNTNKIGVISTCMEGSLFKTSCNGVSCAGAACGECIEGTCRASSGWHRKCEVGMWTDWEEGGC